MRAAPGSGPPVSLFVRRHTWQSSFSSQPQAQESGYSPVWVLSHWCLRSSSSSSFRMFDQWRPATNIAGTKALFLVGQFSSSLVHSGWFIECGRQFGLDSFRLLEPMFSFALEFIVARGLPPSSVRKLPFSLLLVGLQLSLARRWLKRFTRLPFIVPPNLSLNADVPHAGCARQRAAG